MHSMYTMMIQHYAYLSPKPRLKRLEVFRACVVVNRLSFGANNLFID